MRKWVSSLFVTLLMITALCFQYIPVYAIGSYGVNIYSAGYYNKYSRPECTWYCQGRAYEKLGITLPWGGNAVNWYDNAKAYGYSVGSTPRADSIAVFKDVGSSLPGYGHVAYVEKVSGSTVYISEGNYQGTEYHETSYSSNSTGLYPNDSKWRQDIIGYIYLTGGSPQPITFDTYVTPSNNIGAVNFSVWFSNNKAYTLSKVGFEISANGGDFHSYTIAENVVWTRSNMECNLSRYVNTNASSYSVRAFVVIDDNIFQSDTYTISLNTPITFDTYTTPNNNYGDVNFSVWFSNNNAYCFSSAGYEIAIGDGEFATYVTAQDKSWTRSCLNCKLSDFVPLDSRSYKIRAFVKIGTDTFRSDTYTISLNPSTLPNNIMNVSLGKKDGHSTININLQNIENKNSSIVIAFYDDIGKLLDLKTFSPQDNMAVDLPENISYKTAKIMWWEDLASLKPLCESKTISN